MNSNKNSCCSIPPLPHLNMQDNLVPAIEWPLFIESDPVLPNSAYGDSLENKYFEIKINTWVWILVLPLPSFAILGEVFSSCTLATFSFMRVIIPASQALCEDSDVADPAEGLAPRELPVPFSFRVDSVAGWERRCRRWLQKNEESVCCTHGRSGVVFTGNLRQQLHIIVTGQHIGRFEVEDASGCGTRVQGLRAWNWSRSESAGELFPTLCLNCSPKK